MKSKTITLRTGEVLSGKNDESFIFTVENAICLIAYDAHGNIGAISQISQKNATASDFDLFVASILKNVKRLGGSPSGLQMTVLASPGTDVSNDSISSSIDFLTNILTRFNLKINKKKMDCCQLVFKFDFSSGEIHISKKSKSEKAPSGILMPERPIRLLIVDDSLAMQRILKSVVSHASKIELVGIASSAMEAEVLRKELRPDVLTLDIHMPEKDGVTYLSELMRANPMPVIMVSDLSLKEASPVMKALELGAFEYIQKPAAAEISEFGPKLNELIIAGFQSFETRKKRKKSNEIKAKPSVKNHKSLIHDLICIGASTGGTEAIKVVFKDLPPITPPILIVQHMPAAFTGAFAASLNRISAIEVKEAADGDVVEKNKAYLAPGGKQMKILENKNGGFIIQLTDDAPVNRFKPSVDYLFHSVAKLAVAKKTTSILLTGMGDDGARGLLAMKTAGSHTIAQNEESCVVFGMPKAAISLNAADEIVDINDVARILFELQNITQNQPLKYYRN